jgi:kumamolisin
MSHPPFVKSKPYFKLRRKANVAHAAVDPTAVPWTVPALCAAYSWPTGQTGAGVIAIVELEGGWAQSDMDAFFASIGQPLPQITDVSVDGTKNTPNQFVGQENDPDIEVALDIQIAAASYFVATGKPASIRVYWSNQDIPSAVQMAANDGGDVCSISWGSDEANWGNAAAGQMESVAAAATAAGMVVFGAAGDNDAGDGGRTPANVDCPSSCPHVIGCGGTFKTPTQETVWNDAANPSDTAGQGTGGGYSTVFDQQAFQIGAPPAPAGTRAGTGRMVPDVTGAADPSTGYHIFVHGAPASVGGTSAVAPLYSGLFASFGTKLGFVTPTLWQNQRAFNDITVGGNGFYQAGPGPDPCSGIGSPIGTAIAALFDAGPKT